MPTSVNVTNLKINELKEAQYDTAVQQGVIGENELSILTDVDAGQVIQVATLPTASADELDNIYQFVGTTDANYTNGYFYKCVSDGQQPATYSWSNIQVQASSGGLPSQTGNAGKFLTTDGTDASWSDKPLVNTSIRPNGLGILGDARSDNSTAIGNSSIAGITVGYQAATAIGRNAKAYAQESIAIGDSSEISSSANGAIQLGYGTNSSANTFKVKSYEIMSADGTIPTARLTKVNSTITLTSAGWSSNTQTVTVNGVTSTSVVLVAPDPSDTADYVAAGILCTSQATNSLTFTATTTPTNDIDVNIVCL